MPSTPVDKEQQVLNVYRWPRPLHRRLKQVVAARDMTIREALIEAVEAWLKRQKT